MSCYILQIPPPIPDRCTEISRNADIPSYQIIIPVELGVNLLQSEVIMQVYNGEEAVIDISNGNGITIENSLTMTIDAVNGEDNNIPVGVHLGDIIIKSQTGRFIPLMKVEYTISQNYSKWPI